MKKTEKWHKSKKHTKQYSPIQQYNSKQKNTEIKWTAQTLVNDFWKMTRKAQKLCQAHHYLMLAFEEKLFAKKLWRYKIFYVRRLLKIFQQTGKRIEK